MAAYWCVRALREALYAKWRQSCVRRIGYGFDAEHYFALLTDQRRHSTLVVRVTFANPWPDDKRETNAPVHQCFMKIADEALPNLHEMVAIKKLEVDVEGDIVPMGQNP